MPSSSVRRGQHGQSLVEAVVSAAVFAVAVLFVFTLLQTLLTGTTAAARQAWMLCAVREEVEYVLSAPWQQLPLGGTYGSVWNGGRGIAVANRVVAVPTPDLQEISVYATRGGQPVYSVAIYKSRAKSPTGSGPPQSTYRAWCDQV